MTGTDAIRTMIDAVKGGEARQFYVGLVGLLQSTGVRFPPAVWRLIQRPWSVYRRRPMG